jgi:hypothetical protein
LTRGRRELRAIPLLGGFHVDHDWFGGDDGEGWSVCRVARQAGDRVSVLGEESFVDEGDRAVVTGGFGYSSRT